MKFPVWFKDASIRRKFIFIAFLTTGGAMVFAILLSTLIQWFMLREELVKSVSAQASIIASISVAEILSNDREAAEKTVGALANIDSIQFAGILDKRGKNFALYVRPGFVMRPHHHQGTEDTHHIDTITYIEVVIPIILEQKQIGMIHVHSSMTPVYEKLGWNILVTVTAAAGAFLVAVMMLLSLLTIITDPLQSLITLMKRVSRDNNFTLRSELHGNDEMGTLATGFNTMLEHIQQLNENLDAKVKQRTQQLLEAQRIAHLGNWEWDIVNDTLYWSDEIYRIFGLTPKEFGATYDAFISTVHPEDRQRVDTHVREALKDGNPYNIDHRILLPDGSLRYVNEQVEVLQGGDGQALKMQGTVQDITARKQAENEIRQLNEKLDAKVKKRTQQLLEAQEELVRKEKLAMLGQVAISVGQELRNPLGVMNNAVYFLQTVMPDADESVKEYLNIIKHEIAGSERIVSDLLDSVLTRPPHDDRAGVRELIEQTLEKLTIPSTVTVKLEIPETLPPLRVDTQQIHQVLRNLISNAVESMPDGGTLEIRAVSDESAKKITISVRDSGVGMTPEHLGKLFQPLFTTKARGIGLGLVIVKNLTQANRGSVKVQSEAGKGTLFTLILPSADLEEEIRP